MARPNDPSQPESEPTLPAPDDPNAAGDSYDLADFDEPEPQRPPVVLPPSEPDRDLDLDREPEPEPARPSRVKGTQRSARPDPEQAARDAASVSTTWSRQAESGPTWAVVAVAALLTAFLVYGAFSAGQIGLGFLAMLVGGLVCVALSYPLAITLEPPLRLTPEQAVNDYFAALSHHLPHYRRMWLLLSDLGKSLGPFASFAEFRQSWKTRLDGWRQAAGVPKFTPLTFRVAEFKSERSAGKSSVEATVTVQVLVRGRESEPPIAEYRYNLGLVKGRDRMWYLNNGSLPMSQSATAD